MQKAERDQLRRLIPAVRTRAKAALGHGVTARQGLEAQTGTLFPRLRRALEAVVARDGMGPQGGEDPPDCSLKRLEADTRVRLASCRGKRLSGSRLWPLHLTSLAGPGGAHV